MLAIGSDITASQVRKRVVVVILSAAELTSNGTSHGARHGLCLWAAIGALAVMSATGSSMLEVKNQDMPAGAAAAIFEPLDLRLIHLYTMDRISNLKKESSSMPRPQGTELLLSHPNVFHSACQRELWRRPPKVSRWQLKV